MDIVGLYELFLAHPMVTTDTRKLVPGSIYVALKGENFNGNRFALQALEQGAAYAIVDEPIDGHHERIIQVEDALQTLQELAGYHRRQFAIPFIAITGSNGKTTTKELVSAVLASHFNTYTTQGNLNNHIGIPLTLLRVGKDAEMAVIEMGANHQQEIAGYCKYVQPTHGIITNCGKAHLEGFGGIEGVRKGKGELFDFLSGHDGTAFAFADYDYLQSMSLAVPHVIWYGTDTGLIQGKEISSSPFLTIQTKGAVEMKLSTQLVGSYNLPNVLCAVTVGHFFGVPPEKIQQAIENYTPTNSRSQWMNWHGNQVILDAYNANPSSMKLAIENFSRQPGERKILLLGAMKELGEESLAEHRALVTLIQSLQLKEVVLVGGDFGEIEHPFLYCNDADSAGKWLREQQLRGALLLVKGSRSLQMEKVLADTN
ncbi:MAG: UDP-N-acetylmuramoyl-tripeptide--D-alanyl-D-alanine ligase [Chitinophagaceae bacterium]|nr:UDP-N-acetylmuramoyl-tripeptide--D-alanyl-D-alanine ligase [Chitinophagaceae bacterium]